MSWVFGPGGGSSTSPGGADKDIQFNNHGSFSGSNLLTTDGSGSLSASTHVSASTYYGDGSNLTGLTASAVNVADGPEFSLQFRRDTPVSGEISGSSNFSVSSDMTKLFVSGTTFLSASVANGQDIFVGSGTTRTIGVLQDSGDDFFVIGQDNGKITLSSSSGIEFVTDTSEGVGSFGSPITVYSDQEGNNAEISLSIAGDISGSGNVSGSNFYLTPGKSIFFDGNAETFKITNNGTNLDVNGANIILNAATQVSASSNLSASQLYATTLNLTSNAVVEGQVIVGQGTGNGYVSANGDSDTRIRFAAAGRGTDSMSIEAGGKAFITLDENGRDELILGDASGDIVHVSGSLTASVGMRVSASAAIGEDIIVGSGTDRTIGVLVDGSDDFFLIGHDAGAVTLSASNGIEFVGGTDGVGSFGSDIKVYETQAGGPTAISLGKSGDISASVNISGSGLYVTDAYVSNVSANGVVVGHTAGRLISHGNFTFASDVLSVPTITASVGIETEALEVTSSTNGSINIGEGISYRFGGNGRLDVFENEFRLNKTNAYQAMFPEQTSNFNIGDSQVFLVDTNGSVVTGSLPAISSGDDVGITFTIKDSGGNASTNDVVIEPNGSQKIDGASAAKITTNYGAITVVGLSSSVNGFGWGIISAT